jgi:hypothetical protein
VACLLARTKFGEHVAIDALLCEDEAIEVERVVGRMLRSEIAHAVLRVV